MIRRPPRSTLFPTRRSSDLERTTLDTKTGTENAHRSQCHAYIFGKHLVGDALSGAIYEMAIPDRKSTRLNSSHPSISYAVFCLKKKKKKNYKKYNNRL